MAKKTRKQFTFESNVDKIIPEIGAAPAKVLNIIGQNLVKEIRPNVPRRSGRLRKSLSYWVRKKEKDLQIGFKVFYAPFALKHNDPIKPVVIKNKELIAKMIAEALNEIGKK